jgi:hypothetical protein
MTLALAISACTAAGAAQPPAQVRSACAALGLNPTELQFEDCTVVLSRSVAARDQAATVQQARAACTQQGLQLGTSQFANCVLDRAQPYAQ